MRTLLVVVLLCIMSTALARPPFAAPGKSHAAAPGNTAGPPPMKGIRQNPGMGSQQVAELVKRQCIDCKILSVRMAPGHGSQVYKVKTLSSEGIVKYVFVDGENGSVF